MKIWPQNTRTFSEIWFAEGGEHPCPERHGSCGENRHFGGVSCLKRGGKGEERELLFQHSRKRESTSLGGEGWDGTHKSALCRRKEEKSLFDSKGGGKILREKKRRCRTRRSKKKKRDIPPCSKQETYRGESLSIMGKGERAERWGGHRRISCTNTWEKRPR